MFSDSDQEINEHDLQKSGFNINKEFAAKYDHNQKRNELEKLEQKYGKNVGDEDYEYLSESSSIASDEEDALLNTRKVETKFNELLVRINNNDKTLMETEGDYFQESDFAESDQGEQPQKRDKKITYKDVIRENALNKLDNDESASDSDLSSESSGGNKKKSIKKQKVQNDFFSKNHNSETLAEE